ncbi:DUF6350 family protein [Micrococcus sp.]|uniref:cell division protein PerM n=1 Tax=Micrococcus sp. TaxID=1271 RepID=UPI002A9169EF|nr:DUF6350 family protein [Micrococcus sp.]MDY6055743.1 DUF6350 family protein [Micrococcus sp.]
MILPKLGLPRPLPLPLWMQGAVEAFVAALTGLLVVVLPTLLVWVTGGFHAARIEEAVQVGAVLWLALHAAPVHVTAATTAVDQSAVSGTVWLVPWALTLLPLWLSWRAGRRLARASYRDQAWQALTGAVVVYALVGVAAALLPGAGRLSVSPVAGAVLPVLLFTVAALAGARREAGTWAHLIGVDLTEAIAARSQYERWAGSYAWSVVRGACVALASLAAMGALLAAGRVGVHWAQIVGVQQMVDAGPAGGLMIALLEVGYMPTFAVWAVAWAAGPGFRVGADSLYSAFGSHAASAPALPVLEALPVTWQSWHPFFLLVPVVAGVLAGWWLLREGENHLDDWLAARWERRWASLGASTAALAALTGLLVGLGSLVPLVLASGGLGVGSMAQIGPRVLATAAALGGWTALGCLVGYLVVLAVQERPLRGRTVHLPAGLPALRRPSRPSVGARLAQRFRRSGRGSTAAPEGPAPERAGGPDDAGRPAPAPVSASQPGEGSGAAARPSGSGSSGAQGPSDAPGAPGVPGIPGISSVPGVEGPGPGAAPRVPRGGGRGLGPRRPSAPARPRPRRALD